MNGILVDSNIILDIATENPDWFDWSSNMLASYADRYTLYINIVIYAEVSVGYKKIEEVEEIFSHSLFKRSSLSWEAAFLAGKVFARYRKSGGVRTQTLPDFFIGAHALVNNFALLTRDVKGYKYYFPQLKLITPNIEN